MIFFVFQCMTFKRISFWGQKNKIYEKFMNKKNKQKTFADYCEIFGN